MATKHIRLKRYDPRHGMVLRQYWYKGIKFLESEGWYVVDDDVAKYLKENARQRANDPQSSEAFDICTEKEAREIDEKEVMETQPRRPAEKARATAPRGGRPTDVKKIKRRARKLKRQADKEIKPEDEPPAKEEK